METSDERPHRVQRPAPPTRRRAQIHEAPGRPQRPHGGRHADAPASAGRLRGALSAPTGLRISALTVLALSAIGLAAWALPDSAILFSLVIALASCLLALGWPHLVGSRMSRPARAVLALSGLAIPLSVAVARDLAVVAPAFGLSLVALVIATVLTAPAPVVRTSAADGPDGPSAWAGSSTSAALTSGVSALLIVGGGSAWVALDALDLWSVTVPMACLIVPLVVWGDQIGSTYRAQSAGALVAAVVGGLVASVAAWRIGTSAALLPVILPGVARSAGELTAILLLGVTTGVAVALAVILVDGVFGDHARRQSTIGAISRGAAKFLVAAIPVYAMIRIGGV
ncbi:hypothetical protein M3T53_07210 [Actinomyces sp. B33]|uniref:hypothetical protein n=1 Tax=Actinomyces sp. B33 TaxID=2942131 RepID=UPI00234092D3|nr:hypothetical protein [Actinomyces sp. B33]MDC4233493.1 hypothetical protein [Actinomyces sp. B33]